MRNPVSCDRHRRNADARPSQQLRPRQTGVLRAGYIDEVAWQGQARLADVDPVGFLREAAWVVLSQAWPNASSGRIFSRLRTPCTNGV